MAIVTSTNDLIHYHVPYIALEATLKGFDLANDTVFLASLADLGFNYRTPRHSYPYPEYMSIIKAILAHALPGVTDADAGREWGRHMYDGVTQTIFGRVAMAAFHIMALERALNIGVQNLNRGTPFGNRSLVYVGPQHYRITFEDDPGPAYHPLSTESAAGLVERLCTIKKAHNTRITVHVINSRHFEVDVEWEPLEKG